MQNIIINYDGQNLSLTPGIEIIDENVTWIFTPITPPQGGDPQPPLPPNLFRISIFYTNAGCNKNIINQSVINNTQLQTNLSNIPNQFIKVSILLYFCANQQIIHKDVDVVIRRESINI